MINLKSFLILALILNSKVHSNFINSIYYLGKDIPSVYDFSSFDLDRVSHILYAFADIRGNQAIVDFEQAKQKGKKVLKGHLGALVSIKQKHRHVKTGISILGDFGSMVPTQEGRTSFVSSVIDIMKEYGFDFVDLDWEFPVHGFAKLHVKGNPDDAKYMLELLREFHLQFKEKLKFRAFITMAVPVPAYYLEVYQFSEINQYIEYYNTMTYDFSGPFTNYAYHASNLYAKPGMLSVDNSIQRMLAAGLPADKMVVGLPAYAVVFSGCQDKKPMSAYNKKETQAVGDNGYAGVSDLRWDKIEINWDDDAKANWGWFAEKNMFISYESTKAANLKMEYIIEKGLRGAMVWSLAQDFPISDSRSLVTATTNKLGLDNLDSSNNNINYPDSSFENVRNPSFVVSSSSIISPSLLMVCILSYLLLV